MLCQRIVAILLFSAYWGGIYSASPILAQIIPDNTLDAENSIVTPEVIIKNAPADLIEGGAIRGNNLFHSFRDFNILNNQTVYFANPDGIANILTRITGNNTSQIFGKLGVNGNANLFLLNPNGIIFGNNASLDLNGSFFATTADSYIFGNGETRFSAKNPETAPLLTVNLQPGLQMGELPKPIIVRGNGHLLTGGSFFPLNNNNLESGLQIGIDRTLGLIAGEIELDGGILKTAGGNIEIIGIEEGNISFDFKAVENPINVSEIKKLGNIKLKNRALLDASGLLTGNIRLRGKKIALENASAVIIQNLGIEPSGEIAVNASDSIALSGSVRNVPDITTPQGSITGVAVSRFTSETLGEGNSGDIFIAGRNLSLNESSSISARSYSNGNTGNLNLKIAETLKIEGTSVLNPIIPSLMGTTIFNTGDSGKINISARNIDILDGGTISSLNFGSGKGGDMNVKVTEQLKFSGANPINGTPSTLSSTVYRIGNSSNVTIDADRIALLDGSRLSTSTLAAGDAGQLIITTLDSIIVKGTTPDGRFNSVIASDAQIVDPLLRQLLRVPDRPTGNSGNLTIDTSNLILADGGDVAVSNQGLGDSGSLKIESDLITLDNNAGIAAFSASGKGGNINLQVRNWLSLDRNSSITARAIANSRSNRPNINGGNIDLDTGVITLLNNSQINANATAGNGGNINITTEGLFISPRSLISASSELGLDGTVNVENINGDRSVELDTLPANLINATEQIIAGCNIDSDFTFAGNGGLPDNPTQYLRSKATWQDLRILNISNSQNTIGSLFSIEANPVKEARDWQINQRGNVELIANLTSQPSLNSTIGDRQCSNYITNHN